MPSSLNYNCFLYTHIYIYIYIYIRTDPITLPCSLARAGNKQNLDQEYSQLCLLTDFKTPDFTNYLSYKTIVFAGLKDPISNKCPYTVYVRLDVS